ncbi:hypothetical protein [Streptomyces sp. NPDC101455]|uniref:hypothetical protein n=1 Tax=Streptomyces sp. NPDC101455 TaxID=3366142 RepID=UPI00382E459F
MQTRTETLAATPAALSRPAGYDRHRWEEALLASDMRHDNALLLGWALAHMAGTAGYLPAGTTSADRLAGRSRLNARQVRLSLTQLDRAGLISRPDIRTWEPKELVRPITLTLPASSARTEPPHTGVVPE